MAPTGITKALAHLSTIPILSPDAHPSEPRLPTVGSSCFGSYHGSCGSHPPKAYGTSPQIHTVTSLRSAHWVGLLIDLLPPHCSSRKPQTDAYPLPDEGVVNGCLDIAGCTLWKCPGPPVLLRYVSPSDVPPSQSHIHSLTVYQLQFSNTSTEALGYSPLQNQVRQT